MPRFTSVADIGFSIRSYRLLKSTSGAADAVASSIRPANVRPVVIAVRTLRVDRLHFRPRPDRPASTPAYPSVRCGVEGCRWFGIHRDRRNVPTAEGYRSRLQSAPVSSFVTPSRWTGTEALDARNSHPLGVVIDVDIGLMCSRLTGSTSSRIRRQHLPPWGERFDPAPTS